MSSLDTVKAILILNAKKGWTDAARKKAALTRKAKSKDPNQGAYSGRMAPKETKAERTKREDQRKAMDKENRKAYGETKAQQTARDKAYVKKLKREGK